jgi:hypothetical protein
LLLWKKLKICISFVAAHPTSFQFFLLVRFFRTSGVGLQVAVTLVDGTTGLGRTTSFDQDRDRPRLSENETPVNFYRNNPLSRADMPTG